MVVVRVSVQWRCRFGMVVMLVSVQWWVQWWWCSSQYSGGGARLKYGGGVAVAVQWWWCSSWYDGGDAPFGAVVGDLRLGRVARDYSSISS